MKARFYVLIFVACCLATSSLWASAAIPIANSTWAYDTIYNNKGKSVSTDPGLFAQDIDNYNAAALPGHKVTQIFSYGGDLEMYCQGSGGSQPSTPCTDQTLYAGYDADSTKAYYDAANSTPNPVQILPIIDGQIGSGVLKTFNNLDKKTANLYADKVAATYCADDTVTGVQFDLEPFDISKSGQNYFYQEIAKDFAGLNSPNPDGSDPLHCVDAAHPQGRIFSVFTFADELNQQTAKILNQYGNGYMIDSLYDLGPNPPGKVNSPTEYQKYASIEIVNLKQKAAQYQIKYQIGIPAAATPNEYESVGGKSTGFSQIDYVTSALNIINNDNVRNDANFRGMDIWGFNQGLFYKEQSFTAPFPSTSVLNYLGSNL